MSALGEGATTMGGGSNGAGCVDQSRLAMAIFGAIFGTLLLCTGFALAIWYLVRNHQLADKLFFLDRRRRPRDEEEEEKKGQVPHTFEHPPGQQKMKLAELSVSMEMEEIPLEKAGVESEKVELDGVGEVKEEIGGVREGKEEKEVQQVPEVPLAAKLVNGRAEEANKRMLKTARHGVILNPAEIERPSEVEALPPPAFSKSNGTQRKLQMPPSIAEEEHSPEMAEQLRAMLSAEQLGMLEANRRRLEQERRQLRELGVI